jgi:hypothetical protein
MWSPPQQHPVVCMRNFVHVITGLASRIARGSDIQALIGIPNPWAYEELPINPHSSLASVCYFRGRELLPQYYLSTHTTGTARSRSHNPIPNRPLLVGVAPVACLGIAALGTELITSPERVLRRVLVHGMRMLLGMFYYCEAASEQRAARCIVATGVHLERGLP